ncbi:hypothetical protein SAMN04489724_2441 [Algoriphagus locisalis]|uniref:Carbon-nitrogen hydrolase n=1 Tax=Algoriphagus locisalis TaxID=305507 RepID=A0A1I7BHZ7_9BACT|nr:hypothetical protein [Algoriphagus locisalis]SFT86777.1 hypothetical protein SAMN04489724_2441 [Algoriphagus locisalis]
MTRRIITLFILTVFVWLIWSFSGRNTPLQEPRNYLSVVQEINPSDSLSRNIVGIQPFMEVSDYFNQVIFKGKIRSYLVAATGKAFIKKNTIIVYPENIGTWLFLLNEIHSLSKKQTFNEVMKIIAFSNAFDFFLGYLKTGDETNKDVSSIIRMKAKAMVKAYSETFRELAIETNTYILAGSILLPEPKVVDGDIYLNLSGPLYNASFLFGPDGKIIGNPILKSFLNSTEEAYTSSGDPKNLQVFDLPFGKTCIIPFNDSWHPMAYENAINDSAEIILSTSFFLGNQTEHSLWKGYDGISSPENIDLDDVGKLSNKDAWEKYSLPKAMKETKAQVGMNVFFRGDFWDLGPSGQPIVVLNNQVLPVIPAGKGGVWSLNF